MNKEIELQNEIKKSKDVVKRRLGRIESVNKIIEGVQKIQQELENGNFDKLSIDTLINMNIKLTTHLYYLGTLSAEATAEANFAYSYRKFDFNRQWKVRKQVLQKAFKKITNADIESDILTNQWKDTKKEIEKKYYADTLIFYCEFVNTLINCIKDRIKRISSEATKSRYQEG